MIPSNRNKFPEAIVNSRQMIGGIKFMEQQLSIIDIFCGIGGMSKGFLDAGYEVK